jgi:hypothetical protein
MTNRVLPVLLCLVFFGCGPSASEKKKTIESVLSQRLAAKALFGTPRNPQQYQTNSVAFLQALKAIDASQCPADFREAWSDYVAIVERSSARFIGLITTNLTATTDAGVSAVSTNSPDAASPSPSLLLTEPAASNKTARLAQLERQILVYQQDIDKAWADLQIAAGRHGVKAER